MLNQSLVGRMCEWRMITPSLQGDAVNGMMASLANGHALLKTGIILWRDYIVFLPGLVANIIGFLHTETLLSAMIFLEQRPLVIFGKSSFVKENDHPLNDNPFL